MKEERYHIALDRYDRNIVINALNTLRTRQIQEDVNGIIKIPTFIGENTPLCYA